MKFGVLACRLNRPAAFCSAGAFQGNIHASSWATRRIGACAAVGISWRFDLGRADPLLTSGIGLASCAKIGPDLKPGAGLDHVPNALMFYWTQGYLSAANIYLLNEYTDYIDVGAVTEPQITKLIANFCKNNLDKKPISALDKFICDADKIEAKESDAFDRWEH